MNKVLQMKSSSSVKVVGIEENENRQQLHKVEHGQEGECSQECSVDVEDEEDEISESYVYPNRGSESGSSIKSRSYVT